MSTLTKVRNKAISLALASIIAATVLATSGAGSARAEVRGWTVVNEWRHPYAVALICKQYTTGGYGAMWKIKMAALASQNSRADIKVDVYRNTSWGSYRVNGNRAKSEPWHLWASAETYASIVLGDYIRIYSDTGSGNVGQAGPSYLSLNSIGYCG